MVGSTEETLQERKKGVFLGMHIALNALSYLMEAPARLYSGVLLPRTRTWSTNHDKKAQQKHTYSKHLSIFLTHNYPSTVGKSITRLSVVWYYYFNTITCHKNHYDPPQSVSPKSSLNPRRYYNSLQTAATIICTYTLREKRPPSL